jgi:alkylation response protein AidB-like acyl-CoA dehydrogenase/catechol 2,3-dioxygenase-like lactoylglutathione lyase family enzyme
MDVVGLAHVAIVAPDLEAAQAFYGNVLGLKERTDRPDDGRPGHWMDLGDQQLHVILPGGPQNHFAIQVTDIDAAVAELRSKGIDLPDPYGIGGSDRRDGEAAQSIFVDPFGNRVELIQQAAGTCPESQPGDATEALAWVSSAASEIATWGDSAEKAGRLPPALLDALHGAGMFRLLLPRWLGGSQLDPAGFVAVMEALAALDASTAWCVCQAGGCSIAAGYLDRAAAAKVFGSSRPVLAWGPDSGTQAVAVEDGYVVSGNWSYVSGIHHADWLGGSCRVFNPDGTPRLTPAGSQETRTMLFPAVCGSVTEAWNTVGLRATGTDSFSVSELFVPSDLSFAREDVSTRRDQAPLYAFAHASIFAAGFAGVVLGMARGALDAFVSVAQKKTPLGRERALRDSPLAQAQIARCEARYRAARAFLVGALNQGWREATSGYELSAATKTAIRLAASHAFSEASELVDIAYHAAGIDAIFIGSGFERRLRDIHAATQQFQGRDDHYEAAGRALLAAPES